MIDFCMPTLGADMTKGTIVKWMVAPGDRVARGDIIADVETDKGVIAVESWDSGRVGEIVVPEGLEVPVGTVLARLDSAEPAATVAQKSEAGRHRVTPLARKIAKARGIDISQVAGSGPHGEVSKRDVEVLAESAPAPVPAPVLVPASVPQVEVTPSIGGDRLAMRRAITAAMQRSKRDIPHYYIQKDITLQKLMTYLDGYNRDHPVTERMIAIAPILKAVGLVLREFPDFRGWYRDDVHVKTDAVHISMVISLRGGGLIAPCIHDVDKLGAPALMLALTDVTQRARLGKLRSSELLDGVVGVTSLGERGGDSVYGVIYPPQVAMIGVGGIVPKPWAENAMIGVHYVTTMTVAGDHRVSDGHAASRFLTDLNDRLQSPEVLWQGAGHEYGTIDKPSG